MRTITRLDAEWPVSLDEMAPHEPPDVLYARGRKLPSEAPSIAIVGTRRPTLAGIEVAQRIARGLAEGGFTVVSGMAVGIDAAAHQAALEAGGHTIAVLGCGLDVSYPVRNRALKEAIAEGGTLVTEYAEGTQPLKHHFPARNRIVAGLSLGVVVVEGGLRSGALVTARLALDANRSVFAVPGSLRNPMAAGPNELIKTSRAALVTSFKDICDDLAPGLVWAAHAKDPGLADPLEIELLGVLDDAPAPPDRLVAATAAPPGEVAMALSRLEVRGYVGRSYAGYRLSEAGARARAAQDAAPRA